MSALGEQFVSFLLVATFPTIRASSLVVELVKRSLFLYIAPQFSNGTFYVLRKYSYFMKPIVNLAHKFSI